MFNFFKRKGGKAEPGADDGRSLPNPGHTKLATVPHAPTDEKLKLRKDVINLLIPQTNYNQKTGVGAILEIMAGKRKRGKRSRAESCRISPAKETTVLQRSNSERKIDAVEPTHAENTPDDAEFVKALVLQKYSKNNNNQHVSLVYVEPDLEEKRHAEALLREIARSIDCTVDQLNEDKMGATDSKSSEPLYESIDERAGINNYRNELRGELEKLADEQDTLEVRCDVRDTESPSVTKKSNLKPPKLDVEGCSDDDRSDCGKKKVTFRKHIVFDDGEQQTDEEVCSFESISSSDDEYLEDADDLFNDNKTVINVNESTSEGITIKVENPDVLKRISSDNSDSGFVEIGDKSDVTDKVCEESESESEESEASGVESESEEEIIEEIIEEEISYLEADEVEEIPENVEQKNLVSQETKFQTQVAALTELSDNRSGEAERAREIISAYRKEIEDKDQEIEQLKCELTKAYKESELVKQRGRSLEEDLSAAKSCSADLAEQLKRRNDESIRQLRAELEDALAQRAELESRLLALERDKDRLEQEKVLQEQRAKEALTAAEASTAKWRAAHEAARSQAAARAERMLADCEWKMRELEKRARDSEKQNKELTQTVECLKTAPKPTAAHVAELQQLRGVVAEQQRSVQSLTLQLQKVETREEALKLEVHRLKELLERETRSGVEKDDRHRQELQRLEQQHSKAVETLRAEHQAASASTRAALERGHAERTRAALAQMRAEADQEAKNADRKLREVTTRFENLKEVLASKESQFERAIAEANSKADWDIMQLRHLLDKADINYANKVEELNERYEREKESLIQEWSDKVEEIEEEAATAAEEARKLLDSTKLQLIAQRLEQVNKLKEQHRREMDEQWEQFMTDKESCLERMKLECRQEGDEERVKREKELLEEIAELKSQLHSKSSDFDHLAVRSAACGRTLAVTEEELRDALAREKELREKKSEDATKIKQMERATKDQIEHLTRKCACLRKLFDDQRARLAAREKKAEQEARAKDKELHQLRGEVTRLTKLLFEQNAPKLGARTRADGCENLPPQEEIAVSETTAPRRKGGTLRTPELIRKRPTLPELSPLPPQARRTALEFQNGRRRAKSVDLPAVQVPTRIKQLEDRNKD